MVFLQQLFTILLSIKYSSPSALKWKLCKFAGHNLLSYLHPILLGPFYWVISKNAHHNQYCMLGPFSYLIFIARPNLLSFLPPVLLGPIHYPTISNKDLIKVSSLDGPCYLPSSSIDRPNLLQLLFFLLDVDGPKRILVTLVIIMIDKWTKDFVIKNLLYYSYISLATNKTISLTNLVTWNSIRF